MRKVLHPLWISITLIVLSLTWAPSSHALETVVEVEGITEYRLDNGLRVLMVPDPSRPTATINITYLVGSKHEGPGETGMAHLLEHMLFYGTPNHQDIKAEISERGGVANGTTWYERTNYFQTLPAGIENLEWAIRMEADRMVNSIIDANDLASEMTVVRNEFEIGESNPIQVLLQRVMSTAYLWHGYGQSTIGARSDIENVPIERLHQFYRRYYQPDNAILILSGNLDVEQSLALVNEHFGAIPAPDRSTPSMMLWPSYTREPTQDGERAVTVRRSGTVRALLAAYHVPAAAHDDFAAIEVLSYLLGDMPSGRLHERLVETELATLVGSFTLRLPEPSVLMLFAQSRDGQDMDEIRAVVLDTVDALAERPPTEEEVQRAINALSRQFEQTLNDSGRIGIQLSEWTAAGDWRLMFLHRDRIEAVTVDDVVRVAEHYLRRDNRTIGHFIPDSQPQRADIPEAPDLAELLANYQGREARGTGEAFHPSAENIEARLQRHTLSNGTRVALLPKSTRGERVFGQVTMRTGSEETLMDLGVAPSMTSSMLGRGAGALSRQEIRDRIDALQSSLNVGGGWMVRASMETQRTQLPELLNLLETLLREPTFPERELAELKRQSINGLEQAQDDPGSMANHTLNRHLDPYPPGHPEHVLSWAEEIAAIEALERQALVDFHATHYGFGPNATISLVGDFEPQEVLAQLEALFGEWTTASPFERLAAQHVPTGNDQLITAMEDKANAVLLATHSVAMRTDHPDYPALVLAGHMLGGGFLSSRLANRLRDQDGLSYSVGGGFNASDLDESGGFRFFAAFAPDAKDQLVEGLFEELERALAEGFAVEEVTAAQRGFLQQLEVRRSNDFSLAGLLNQNLYLDRDAFHQAAFEAAIAELDADTINAALRRHMDLQQLTLSLAGEFAADPE